MDMLMAVARLADDHLNATSVTFCMFLEAAKLGTVLNEPLTGWKSYKDGLLRMVLPQASTYRNIICLHPTIQSI